MRAVEYLKRVYETVKDFYKNSWGREDEQELGLGAMVKEDFERLREGKDDRRNNELPS